MASFNIHLAIGKLYIEKNKIYDEERFLYGTIAPDLDKDKNISHYSGIQKDNSVIGYLRIKVILPEFLKANKLDTDYNRGVFLHLVVDYLFYNYFFKEDYLKSITYNDFTNDLYYSYDCISKYIEDKYKIETISFKEILENNKKKQENDINRTNIIDVEKLDNFIAVISNINLEKYAERIIKAGINILPDELGNYVILQKRG